MWRKDYGQHITSPMFKSEIYMSISMISGKERNICHFVSGKQINYYN